MAAVGITANRGSKGAGPLEPSFADFISSGGMVTGDRFQFFVWTLVGFLGFLLLVLLADPSTLKDWNAKEYAAMLSHEPKNCALLR